MPVDPSTWAAGPVSATQLNLDLYAFQPGNNHAPNGILFHSTPPLYMAWGWKLGGNIASSAGGTFTRLATLGGTSGNWFKLVDTQARLAPQNDLDLPGARSYGSFEAGVTGASGGTFQTPGLGDANYLTFAQVGWTAQTNNTGMASATIGSDGGGSTTSYAVGNAHRPSAAHNNMPWVLDLARGLPGTILFPNALCADASAGSFALTSHLSDPSGDTSRIAALWVGMGNTQETPPVPSTVPLIPSFTSVSQITSAGLNAQVKSALQLLNNRPQIRVGTPQSGSIAVGSAVTLHWSVVNYNNNPSNWNSGTWTYTVPLDGIYLVHVMPETATTTGRWRTGVTINGSTTISGPDYDASNPNTRPTFTRLLDLAAGDTLFSWVFNTGTTPTLTGSGNGKMIIVWMAARQTGSPVTWTPPDPGFRWQAGTPGAQLPALFNQHITNDLNFLIWRPYLLSYQTTAQTSLTQNLDTAINMQTVSGVVHSSLGDPYGGWVPGGSPVPYWAAPVAGWYLVVDGFFQTIPTTPPAVVSAKFQATNSSGTNMGTTYKLSGASIFAPATDHPGTEGIGLVYLSVGDRVYPVYIQQDGGTYSTVVSTPGFNSHFGLVWVSE